MTMVQSLHSGFVHSKGSLFSTSEGYISPRLISAVPFLSRFEEQFCSLILNHLTPRSLQHLLKLCSTLLQRKTVSCSAKENYVNIVFVYEAGKSQHNPPLCVREDHITVMPPPASCFFKKSSLHHCPWPAPTCLHTAITLLYH